MTFKPSLKYVTLLALPLATMTTFASSAAAFEPEGKVECIAPSDPGGGWDFTCRSVGNVMQELDLVPANVQTINMAGAGGGVAFAHTVSKRAGDDHLMVAASTATTTRLAQGQFPGLSADMVNWVGALGADYGIIAVGADSEIDDLNELMDRLKEDPRSVKFAGGSAKGGWDHLKVLIAAQAADVENLPRIAYLSYNNGGEALTQVIGGHVDAFTGDITEAQGFMESGDLRVLAVLSEERLPGDLAEIPTAREQGIDALGPNWRGFYMPADVSEDAQAYWTDAMDTIYQSEEWQSVMAQNGLMPFHMTAGEFEDFVLNQIKDIEQLSKDIGLIQ
ncbi:Bug family tripartite tricarboxylate transporter substrate binding protein [Vreelandella aquamarina]